MYKPEMIGKFVVAGMSARGFSGDLYYCGTISYEAPGLLYLTNARRLLWPAMGIDNFVLHGPTKDDRLEQAVGWVMMNGVQLVLFPSEEVAKAIEQAPHWCWKSRALVGPAGVVSPS